MVVILGLGFDMGVFADAPETTGNAVSSGEIIEISPLKVKAALIPGGEFQMGSAETGSGDEKPQHRVILSDFYLSITEVTIGQYKEFCRQTGKSMPRQEDYAKDNYPVAFVTWYEAQEFCQWAGGSLPTEAQWEYAARAGGKPIVYPNGNEITHDHANFEGVGERDRWKKSAPVGKFPPSVLGLYDMAGNIYEWCYDNYKSDYYSVSTTKNPKGPATGMFRVLRGGSWYHGKEAMRTTYRFRFMPVARVGFVGFRVAWEPGTITVPRPVNE